LGGTTINIEAPPAMRFPPLQPLHFPQRVCCADMVVPQPTTRPVLSPINAIVTVIFPSNGPQLPPALAPASSPVVTTSTTRFGAWYNVATVACPRLTVVVIINDIFFRQYIALVVFVQVAFTPPPLFVTRHRNKQKSDIERGERRRRIKSHEDPRVTSPYCNFRSASGYHESYDRTSRSNSQVRHHRPRDPARRTC